MKLRILGHKYYMLYDKSKTPLEIFQFSVTQMQKNIFVKVVRMNCRLRWNLDHKSNETGKRTHKITCFRKNFHLLRRDNSPFEKRSIQLCTKVIGKTSCTSKNGKAEREKVQGKPSGKSDEKIDDELIAQPCMEFIKLKRERERERERAQLISREREITRKLPWLTSMQVNLNQRSGFESFFISNLLVKVMTHQFLITWVESEPWWQPCSYVS